MRELSIFYGIFTIFILGADCLLILEGHPDIGIPPELAGKVCESFGGKLAVLTEENRLEFEDKLFRKCNPNTGICPKICAYEVIDDDVANSTELAEFSIDNLNSRQFSAPRIAVTQPIFEGDSLHIRMEIPDGSMEVLQLADSILEDIENRKQNVILQLSIFSNYKEPFDNKNSSRKGVILNGIAIGTGKIAVKLTNNFVVPQSLYEPKYYRTNKSLNGTIDFTLRFIKPSRLEISSKSLFSDKQKPIGVDVSMPGGRVYFKKFYDQSRLVDAYFTRGNCTKDDFRWNPPNETDLQVNCLWTRPMASIPVYSCRMASYAACENISDHVISTTGKPAKPSKNGRSKERAKEKPGKPAEEYFYADFMDENEWTLLALSMTSIGLLVGSIVLQMLKDRESMGKEEKSKGKKKKEKKTEKKKK